jgi:hypothetical protein
MKHSAMVHGSRPALLAATAGICLALTACGGGSAASSAKPAATTAAPAIKVKTVKMTGHFCLDLTATMRNIPTPGSATKEVTLAAAQQELTGVARTGVSGFSALQAEAPKKLVPALRTIVAIYRADEKVIADARSTTAISRSLVSTDAPGQTAFQEVLSYMSLHCK